MYRFVIIPQALRRALPGTTGQLVSLLKDSSLLSVIGIEEVVKKVQIMNAATYSALEGYIPLALAYLIVTLPLAHLARRLEGRFAYET
jgi:polar amino acid transport system permease protein